MSLRAMMTIRCWATYCAIVLFVFLSFAKLSIASPGQDFGLDADTTARAMLATAKGSANSAAATNPARLIEAHAPLLSIDLVVADDALRVNDKDPGLSTYIGYNLAFATPIPIGKWKDRLFVGVNAHFPNDGLYQLKNPEATAPRVLYGGSYSRRLSVEAAVAVRLWEKIGIGLGLTLAPQVGGNVHIDFSQDGNTHTTEVSVKYQFAPSVGIYAHLWDGLHLGFSYRSAVQTQLDVFAEVLVSESIGAIRTSVSAIAFGEPHEFSFGIGYDFSDLIDNHLLNFGYYAEFTWQYFSAPMASVAIVKLYDEAGGVLETNEAPAYDIRDAWRFQTALDWMPLEELTVSIGYGFRQTPIKAQRGMLNILDSGRHQFAFGASYWLPESLELTPRIGFGLATRIESLLNRHMEKSEFFVDNPGFPYIKYGGLQFSVHFTLSLSFE